MPRYRFKFDDDKIGFDRAGWVFPDLAAAKCEAARMVGAMICDSGAELWTKRRWGLTVSDAAGNVLFTLGIVGSDAAEDGDVHDGRPGST